MLEEDYIEYCIYRFGEYIYRDGNYWYQRVIELKKQVI